MNGRDDDGGPLPDATRRGLERLAADLAPAHRLAWRDRLDASGRIASTLDGRPMIGNRTHAHAREMAHAMTQLVALPGDVRRAAARIEEWRCRR